MQGYEREVIDICKKLNKNIEIYAIIPKMLSKQEYENLSKDDIDGIRISIESDEMGIYKSFNYEILKEEILLLLLLMVILLYLI